MIDLRPATWSDRYALWRWRNQPFVRCVSRDTSFIPLKNHLQWLEKTISAAGTKLLIAYVDNAPIGVLRFDYVATEAEVSIYLTKTSLGRGLAVALLQAGRMWLQKNKLANTIIAFVQPDNIASHKSFLRAGFIKKADHYELTIA